MWHPPPRQPVHITNIWVFEHIFELWRTPLRVERSLTITPQFSLILHNWKYLFFLPPSLPKHSLKNCFKKLATVSREAEGTVRSTDFFNILFRQIKSGKYAVSVTLNIWLLFELDLKFVSNVQELKKKTC